MCRYTKSICVFADVANAWLETLLDVIDLLPKDVIKKDVGIKSIRKHPCCSCVLHAGYQSNPVLIL